MREALCGNLEEIRLASVIQLADGEVFTGLLELPGGRLELREGSVVAARAGELDGMAALRELFLIAAGPFRLVRSAVEATAPLGSTLGLVMEGVRLADEWDRLAPMVLDELDGWPAEPAGAVDRPFLDALDGRRTLYAIVRERGVAPTLVLDRILQLLDEGVLVEAATARTEEVRELIRQETASAVPDGPSEPAYGAGSPPVAPAPATAAEEARAAVPTDYFAALEAGRRHLRKGRHDEAEEAFEAALAARPGDRVAAQNLKRVRTLIAGGDARYDWFRTA